MLDEKHFLLEKIKNIWRDERWFWLILLNPGSEETDFDNHGNPFVSKQSITFVHELFKLEDTKREHKKRGIFSKALNINEITKAEGKFSRALAAKRADIESKRNSGGAER